MSECTHDCNSCSAKCSSREGGIPKEKLNDLSSVKKVIGVVSGKGGVGKSLVTSMMAVSMQRRGFKAAILDADITGPSIPQSFGVHERATGTENELFPATTKTGIDIMSLNLLVEREPVAYLSKCEVIVFVAWITLYKQRVAAGTLAQFPFGEVFRRFLLY